MFRVRARSNGLRKVQLRYSQEQAAGAAPYLRRHQKCSMVAQPFCLRALNIARSPLEETLAPEPTPIEYWDSNTFFAKHFWMGLLDVNLPSMQLRDICFLIV